MGRRWTTSGIRGVLGAPGARLGVVIVAACLVNGIGPYLRRTGLIESSRYEEFWAVHTSPGGWSSSPFGLGRRCVRHAPPAPGEAGGPAGESPSSYVFAVRPWEVPGKVLKDALLAALVAGSLVAWIRGKSGPVPLGRAWPSAALAALVAWKVTAGLAGGAPLMAVAGLRAFAYLGIALLAGWVTADVLRRLVPWLVGLLAVQALLAPLELLRGIPVQGHGALFGEVFARRATGTFVMPNTLGVFAACVVALAVGYGASARVRGLAWVLGTVVVLTAGSATGLVLVVAIGLWEAVRSRQGAGKVAAVAVGGVLLALVVAFLPGLLRRYDVHDSARARVHAIRAALDGPIASVVFGRQIGLGTNASFQLRDGLGSASPIVAALEGGDSAVVALVLQTGVVGLVLFALSLGLAGLRNPAARPLVFALALASLTLSLTEAFPVNLLLALLLGGGVRSTFYTLRETVECRRLT